MLNSIALTAALLFSQTNQPAPTPVPLPTPVIVPVPVEPVPAPVVIVPIPAPVPVAETPAPALIDDKNVSKLNGQVVPVGEKNRYLYDYPKINISTNPIGYIYGSFTLGTAIALHRHVAIRFDTMFYKNYFGDGFSAGLAMGLPIYFRQVWSGFFIQPGARIAYVNVDSTDLVAGGPEMLAGWHWIWDGGWNVALAAGLQFTFISGKPDDYSLGVNSKGILPTGYFQVGKTF